jgi:hypothetical protein
MDVSLARRPRVLMADDYPQFVKAWQRWLERLCEVDRAIKYVLVSETLLPAGLR